MRGTVMNYKKSSNQNGYTLVEMAIALLIIGLIVGTAIPIYQHYSERTKKDETMITQTVIDYALESFKNIRGRYPCPAPMNAEPGTPSYGRETACTNMTVAPGTCMQGLCHEVSPRTIEIETTDASGAVVTQNVQPRVVRGAIPFKTLGLTEEQSMDSYGGRFSYAVTQMLTDKRTFRIERGGIDVIDGDEPSPNSLVEPAGSALYYVYSHGPDNIGAYSLYGVEIAPCNGPMYDNENCNTSAAHSEATYRYTLQSTKPPVDINAGVALPGTPGGPLVNNETHFDDAADYVGLGKRPIWEIGEDTGRNLMDWINNTDSVDDKVMIGGGDRELNQAVDEDDEDLQLIVTDGLKTNPGDTKLDGSASPGAARVDRICGDGGHDQFCMESAVLGAPAGDARGLRCVTQNDPPNLAPRNVVRNTINCVLPELNCPDDEPLLRGVDANGMPICGSYTAPVTCGMEPRTICGTIQNLPANSPTGTVVTLRGGTSYARTFTCRASTANPAVGEWVAGAATGLCTCTPGVVRRNVPCGSSQTGNIVQEVTTVCPAGTVTRRNISNSCVCTPGTQTQTVPCPTGFTGNITQRNTSQCPSGNWSGWQNVSNTCACRPAFTRNAACPAGYNIGSITENCTYNCNMANLTSTGPTCTQTSNTCACRDTTTVTQVPCPVGYSGQVEVTTTVRCPGGNAVVTRVPNCAPVVSTCTMTVTDNNSLGNSRVHWREGQTCSYSTNQNNCTSIRFCYRVVGTNMYSLHRCACR